MSDIEKAKKILVESETTIPNSITPSNHMWSYARFSATVKILLTQRRYEQALKRIDDSGWCTNNWMKNNLLYLKATALFRMKKYNDAKTIVLSLASPSELGFDEAHLLCHIKLTQHDFNGIDELLSDSEEDEELLHWIKLYSMTWMDFNRQKQSNSTSNEELKEILKCLVPLKFRIYLLLENILLF